jgi:hypothetical protein
MQRQSDEDGGEEERVPDRLGRQRVVEGVDGEGEADDAEDDGTDRCAPASAALRARIRRPRWRGWTLALDDLARDLRVTVSQPWRAAVRSVRVRH